MLPRRFLLVPVFSALAAALVVAHAAAAQPATGTITGRVMWGPCIRAIPLPAQPEGQPGSTPGSQIQPMPAQPPSVSGLPAGAVLVAVQNTSISARTDEAGRFSLSGAPAGQYLTVAAGPVANATSAIAERPNVFVDGGQSVDVGTLNLGGGSTIGFGFPCRVLPGVGAAQGSDTAPEQPGTDTPQPEMPSNNP